jgi:hypothetical protein
MEAIKPFIKTTNDVARNRILNQNTSKGILLLVGAGYLFEMIDEQKLNVLITLLSGSNIGYSDVYFFLFNCAMIYLAYRGVMLILKRAEKLLGGEDKKDKE